MDFDREIENQRLKQDLQEVIVFMTCDICGAEIYEGHDYYDCPAGYLCEDCFDKVQSEEKRECEKIAGDNNEWR